MIVHIKKLLGDAEKKKYALPAFNVANLETINAIILAAEKLKAPLIMQATENAFEFAGFEELSALMISAAENATVPIALHLDHGKTLDMVKKCVDAGFSSVMIDASRFEFAENVKLTKEAVKIAHKKNAWVQAELGRLEGIEDWVKTGAKEKFLTEPEEAAKFVEQTKIDAFAPAIGNYHGLEKLIEKKKIKLDLGRLAQIHDTIDLPLVMHGSSGTKPAMMKKLIGFGIRVFNVDSELRLAYIEAERRALCGGKEERNIRDVLASAIEAMRKVAEKKLVACGCAGKAGRN